MSPRYTPRALNDLTTILDYIAQHSPTGAKRVHQRIQLTVDLLARNPYIGVLTEDPTVRRITTLPYRYLVFYEVSDEEVIIHTIRHSSRAASDL
jgi:addiction module RelE/StbE family toxin